MFKRVLYTGLGAGAGTALCYPDEASEVSTTVYQEGRNTALDAYSFVTGGKMNFPFLQRVLCTVLNMSRFFCFLAKSEEELLKNSLIASSINRMTRFFMRRFKEIKDAVKGVCMYIKRTLTKTTK